MAEKPDFFEREARKARARDELNSVKPFPDECAHPECTNTPIVGVNKRFVCPDHMKWVLKPVRDALSVVKSVFT